MDGTSTGTIGVDVSLVAASCVVETRGERAAMAVEKNVEKDEEMSEIPTSEKLAQALEAANAPREMIRKARAKYYDDWLSELVFPIRQLADDAAKHGLMDIAVRAMNGEFDGTKEEGDAWANSPEGRETSAQFGKSMRKEGV